MNTKTLILRQFALVDIEAERTTINRLLAAAVVSQTFRNQLITDPHQAIKSGFADEQFDLSPHTLEILTSIKASSLNEYAGLLIHELHWLNAPLAT